MQRIQARHFTRGPRRGPVDLVVIHTMEAPEKGDTAEAIARYFATTDRQVSAHYCIDNNSIVACVQERDIAWAAPGANHNGIQLEHGGYARQTAKDWADPYSKAMLRRSAELAADICARHRIPPVWVDAAGLKRGKRGITSHAAVSEAFKGSTHWDPGTGFPQAGYVAMVASELGAVSVLSRRTGYWAWLAWYEGRDDWKPYGPRARRVRPNVPRLIPPAWWARRLVWKQRQKGK